MCGITGWIDWKQDLSQAGQVIEDMSSTLAARGPDAAGRYVSPRAALGHRRLSVVDPQNGAQPMERGKGNYTCVVTYNGELYNTVELRQELAGYGWRFQTSCDTEVLLLAYLEWGEACVEKFNGIFAFAIWDEHQQCLFMARDRIGVKPLFYSQLSTGLVFASEQKALLAHPQLIPQVGAEGLAEILLLGPGRTPGQGIFSQVAELKPGWQLKYSRQGVQLKQYWQLYSYPHQQDFAATAAGVRELMEDIVRRQLVADVPVCTLLSGGLDSSAITALACQVYREGGRETLSTYSVDYRDNERYFTASSFQPNADAPWVKIVAESLQTRHSNIVLDTAELSGSLAAAAIARDAPGMADVDSSLYLFCRAVKEEATVALSGECADEVFGGYPWFYREEMLQANTFPWALNGIGRTAWLSAAAQAALKPAEFLQERYNQALAEVPRYAGDDPQMAKMREIFYLSLTRWMPVLLERKDRMSMAWGLEVRVPFCDHRLVEYVWNVPWHMKNHHFKP